MFLKRLPISVASGEVELYGTRCAAAAGQLPKLDGSKVSSIDINISISCSSCQKCVFFALRHYDDAGCDRLATCMPTVTYGILRGATKKL